jgi:hypothetical protein
MRKVVSALRDYQTGDFVRAATEAEEAASVEAAKHDGGVGVIEVDGRSCYVEPGSMIVWS